MGRGTRTGLGADPAARSAAALADGATIFWEIRAERPASWRRKTFRRWVEAFRRHLDPIRSLDSLAASFAREAVIPIEYDEDGHALAGRLLVSPLLAAYVVRWLELRDGDALEPWRSLAG